MIDLVFFSTNDVKLAHLQYLATGSGFRVVGFRRKSYYASYHEPRTLDRDVLLRESYESALEQWKRTHRQKNDSFFFLEDTSVRIEALSNESEIPGVDVKYWMKDMTFDRLNAQLLSKKNDRRAIVRSDIVLHIPSDIRAALGIKQPFVHFHGVTRGHIAHQDIRFSPNKVFPWLDNRTFNRWFVPQGYDLPISRLRIEQADTVDFRKRAFEAMLKFLAELGITPQKVAQPVQEIQLSLPAIPNQPHDLIICGPSCAGKSTIATYLATEYQYSHLEASDFMFRAFWQRHGPSSRIPIGDFAEAALRVQPAIVADQVREEIMDEGPRAFALTGFRSPAEARHLINHLGKIRRIQIVYIDAPLEVRFKRARNRQRANAKIDMKAFERREKQELRMGLGKIRQELNPIVITNDSTFRQFYKKFRQHFLQDLRLQRRNTLPLWEHFPRHDLENLILVTLGSSQSTEQFFTTSEIAKLINKQIAKFGRQVEKDNVSRYFNQNFYPYYEIKVIDRKRKYRLSNTGVARAKLLRAAKFAYFQRRRPTRRNDGDLFPSPSGE